MTAAVAELHEDQIAPAESAEDTAAKAAAEAAIAVELSKFNDVVSDAIADGTPSEEGIKAVRVAYGKLEPRKGKTLARQALDDDIRKAIENGNLIEAQGLFALKDAVLKGALKTGATRTAKPRNVTASHVERILGIQLGYSLAFTHAPEGVDADWKDQVKNTPELEKQASEYRAWLESGQEGDEPNVPAVAAAGARISLGRGPKGQGRKPKGSVTATEAPAEIAAPAAPAAVPEGWDE